MTITEKYQQDMKQKIKLYWCSIAAVVILLSVGFGVALPMIFNISAGMGLGISILILIILSTIIFANSYIKIEHMHQYIIETFGKYKGYPLEAGMHFILPFGIDRLVKDVYMGEVMMALSLSKNIKEGYGGGDVEFSDTSASLTAYFNFRVDVAELAVYSVSDITRTIEEKADSVLRRFLGLYSLEEAIKLKGKFSMKYIACIIDLIERDNNDEPNKVKDVSISDVEFENSEFYQTLRNWGVLPISFTVSDINIPDNVKAEREKSLVAREDEEAAIISATKLKKVAAIDKEKLAIENQMKIMIAKTERDATLLKGTGESKARAIIFDNVIKALQKKNLSNEDIVKILTDFRKYEAWKKANSTYIIEGQGGTTTEGLKIATGVEIINKNNKEGLK